MSVENVSVCGNVSTFSCGKREAAITRATCNWEARIPSSSKNCEIEEASKQVHRNARRRRAGEVSAVGEGKVGDVLHLEMYLSLGALDTGAECSLLLRN